MDFRKFNFTDGGTSCSCNPLTTWHADTTKMKSISAIIFFLTISIPLFGQWDPVKVFNTRKFPCDSGQTTLEINFCSGDKNRFADSLLNRLYKEILKNIDKDIAETNNEMKKLMQQKKKTGKDSTDLAVFKEELDYHKRLKSSIVTSQRIWLKQREANTEIVSISFEGGTGRTAATIQADTEEILDRIKKLITLCNYY